MHIIDSHTHVDEYEALGWFDPPEVIIELLDEAGIERAVVMTYADAPVLISGLAQADAFLALETCSNLHVGANGAYRQDFLEECIEAFGPAEAETPVAIGDPAMSRVRRLQV